MRSMIKLKRMMLMAKGHRPAPKSSPDFTGDRPKSLGHKSGVLMRIARVMNAVDVVIRAIKQPQNNIMSCLVTWRAGPDCVDCSDESMIPPECAAKWNETALRLNGFTSLTAKRRGV